MSIPIFGSLASSIAGAIVTAFAHAVASGLTAMAAWALGGLTKSATSTTSIGFDTWFAGPWRAMIDVAALVAVPFLFAGVIQVMVRGEGVPGLGRLLLRLVAAGAGALVALSLVRLALALTDMSCELVENTSGISLSAALARMGTAIGVIGVAGGGGVATIGSLILALLAGLAALVLWIELVVRAALVYVATAFLPLGLAGLIWPATAGWLRRLAEVAGAIIASKLVIVVVLVLGAAALTASPVSLASSGDDLDAVITGVAFLGLATLGLPMALRLVPFAAEAAAHAGRGASLVRSGVSAPLRAESAISGTQALVGRVSGSGATAAGAAGGGASPSGTAIERLAERPDPGATTSNGSTPIADRGAGS